MKAIFIYLYYQSKTVGKSLLETYNNLVSLMVNLQECLTTKDR